MKKLTKQITMIAGYYFLLISASGFIFPFVFPLTYGQRAYASFVGALISLVLGLIFRFITLQDKPLKERLLQLGKDYFMLFIFAAFAGLGSSLGILILVFGLIGYGVFNYLLKK